MKTSLTALQSFNAMAKFLELYFHETSSGSLAVLLDSLQFLKDGHPADPALWEDWIKFTDKKITNPSETYSAMLKLLERYFRGYPSEKVNTSFGNVQFAEDGRIINSKDWKEHIDSKNIRRLLINLQPSMDGKIKSAVWSRWMECINAALQEPEGTKSYLELIKNDTNG